MKSKWFVVFLPALMVALLLIPLTVPGFASEEPVSVDVAEEESGEVLSEKVAVLVVDAVSADSPVDADIEEDTRTDCEKGIHHYRDGYGACVICAVTPTPAPVVGDMDGNGTSGATDVISLTKFLLGINEGISARPDVNGDGQFGLDDIIHYLRYIMGEIGGESLVSNPDASPAYWREAATTE